MACGTSADATQHARPRGRAARAHAELRWRNVAWTLGRGHASPRGRPSGAMWHEGGWHLEGPQVSGPKLVVWGGNANALNRPFFYSCHFPLFLRCGTMFPRGFFSARHVAPQWTSDAIALDKGALIACTRVHTIIIKARALKET